MNKKLFGLLVLMFVVLMLLPGAALGQGIVLPEVNALEVTGDIISAGSSTVFPLSERMAERFQDEGYAGNITIDSVGTGAGFERFCVAGETDISNASRAIKAEEIASCQAIGRTPIEFRVGTDALAVVVSSENDFLTDITVEELALTFSTAATWADVRADWPAEPILRFSPGTDSGTFDYFVEAVMDEVYVKSDADEGKGEEAILSAENLQLSEDDNVLVQGVEGSPYAIGYFGYAYYQNEADALKALSIGGVAPTAETAENGDYPLARPLFIYSDANIMTSKPQVADFISFYLSFVNEEIIDVGYFPASDSSLNLAKQAWLEATGTVLPVTLPEVNALEVTGDIISAGSSTVFPLSERMAERFQDEGYAGNITIDSIGSGAGFERFCVAGETDISNASRAIKEEEIASCEAIGRTPIEFRVGTDALTVVVSSENDFLTDITLEELALAFSTAATWADVRAGWPAEPILRFSPGTDSGTFDYFVEAVMDEVYVKSDADEGKGEEAILSAENLQLSEDDNVLVQGVEGSPYAIGYFGFAYYQANQGALKALSIGGVAPTAETAENGDYPLARPLFIYSDAGIMTSKPQVADFINFYLSFVNEEIIDVGYFPASDSSLNLAKQAWLEATAAMSRVKLPEVNSLEVTGDIIAAGSSTVFPLSERMAERFQDEGYTGNITIDSIGSGAGFERFCVAGETDISNASRAINEEEIASCEAIGRTPIEFRVGTDAIVVAVSTQNTFLTDVTIEQLAQVFSTAKQWHDVDPSWPTDPILRFSPGTDSGTFDYFVEAVMDEVYVKSDADEGKGEEAILSAENLQLSEDDNVLVQGVEGSPFAIGYFGFAYYQANQDKLKAIAIGGVAPAAETAENGDYPLARPLFIYSDATIMTSKPQVADFINFYLTYVNEEITDVGYFPASPSALDAAKQTWLGAAQ